MKPHLSSEAWLEDSSPVSATLELSKREVLSLILLAHVWRHQGRKECCVGFDSDGGEA